MVQKELILMHIDFIRTHMFSMCLFCFSFLGCIQEKMNACIDIWLPFLLNRLSALGSSLWRFVFPFGESFSPLVLFELHLYWFCRVSKRQTWTPEELTWLLAELRWGRFWDENIASWPANRLNEGYLTELNGLANEMNEWSSAQIGPDVNKSR